MKKKVALSWFYAFACLAFLLTIPQISAAQVVIASQGFEGTPADNWSYVAPTQAGGVDPVLVGVNTWGAMYAHTGSSSCRAGGGSTDCGVGSSNCLNGASSGGNCTDLSNGTIIEFDPIDVSCYTNVQIELWHRTNVVCVGAGFDSNDELIFEVKIDGGAWIQVGLMGGANNLIWDYYTPLVGSTSQVANPFLFTAPAGAQTVAFRTRANVNRSDEIYYVDDAKITGTPFLPTILVATLSPVCSPATVDLTNPAIVAGSTAGLTFSFWEDTLATIPLTNASNITTSGTYYIKGETSGGCYITMPVTVLIDNPPAVPVVNLTQPDCITTTGTITVASPTGTGLSYSLDGVNYTNTNGVFNSLSATNYTVYVQNSSGCTSSITNVIINSPPSGPAAPTVTLSQPTCAVTTGTITVNAPTGVGYSYSIDNTNYTNTTGVFTNLSAASYDVTVKDAAGCISTITIAIINAPLSIPATPTLSITQPNCTTSTGAITVLTPSGSGLTFSVDGVSYANTTGIFNSLIPNNYFVSVQNGAGCISSVVNITINPQPPTPAAPLFTVTQPTCSTPTGTLTINSPTGAGLLYSNDGINYSNSTGVFNLLTPGTNYSITVQNSFGCTSSASPAVINAGPVAIVPVVVANGVVNNCPGVAVDLTVTTNYTSYQWTFNTAPSPTLNTQLVNVVQPGNYAAIVTDVNGCTAISNTITISNFPVVNPVISSSIGSFDFCPGDSIALSIANGYSNIEWYYNSILLVGKNTSSIFVNASGNYWMLATDLNGCDVFSDSVAVNVVPLPLASISPNGIINACVGASVSLQTSVASSYKWYNNGVLIPTVNNNVFDVVTNGSYYVELFNSLGCSTISDTVTVSFTSLISIAISADNLLPCEGDEVILSTDKVYPSMIWSNGINGPTTAAYSTGDYSIVVDSSGCKGYDTISVSFTPNPVIDAGSDVISDCTNGAQFNAVGNGTISWLPITDLSSDTIIQPIANPNVTTTYYLTLTQGLCSSTDSVKIIVDCSTIYLPSAFSPNEDEVNDYFKASGKEVARFSLKVFNRWGQLVFESKDINVGWDGKFDGVDCPKGLYAWQVEAYNYNNISILNRDQKKGVVSLLR